MVFLPLLTRDTHLAWFLFCVKILHLVIVLQCRSFGNLWSLFASFSISVLCSPFINPSSLHNFHLSIMINNTVEQGRLSWKSSDIIHERAQNFFTQQWEGIIQ